MAVGFLYAQCSYLKKSHPSRLYTMNIARTPFPCAWMLQNMRVAGRKHQSQDLSYNNCILVYNTKGETSKTALPFTFVSIISIYYC